MLKFSLNQILHFVYENNIPILSAKKRTVNNYVLLEVIEFKLKKVCLKY